MRYSLCPGFPSVFRVRRSAFGVPLGLGALECGPRVRRGGLLALAWVLGLAVAARAAEPAAPPGMVRFDFEAGDLQGWRIVEGAFDFVVCDKPRFRNTPEVLVNKQGRWFLTTLERRDGSGSDPMTGCLESPVFVLGGPDMTFLVGGGKHADTYVALCTLDGREVTTARGDNAEVKRRVEWHLPDLVGQAVFLRVVDRNPGGWGHVTFDDFTASGRIDPEATAANFARAEQRRALCDLRAAGSLQPLEAAARALARDTGVDAAALLARAVACRQRFEAAEKAVLAGAVPTSVDVAALVAEIEDCRRAVAMAGSVLAERSILFVARKQYRPDHHNTETMFQTGEINTGSFEGGSALKVLDVGSGAVRTVLDCPTGMIRDPEVHFDGQRVVFAMRRDARDDYHLYEIGVDGTGLRQLTRAPGVTDIDPLYLPDDSLAFSSSREPKYCMCNRHIMCNLFRMNADGTNIHQIGKSTLFEGHGALMPDGRILYDRWEYVDRNFGDAQGLWTVSPDGTNHAVVYGNNTPAPGAVIDARPVPGTHHIICVFGSCHDRPWGALALIDPRRGVDGRPAVLRTWPADAIDRVRNPGQANNDWDAFVGTRPKFEDPYPLDDRYVLCSRMTGEGEQMGICLLDSFGNEILLYREGPGCFDPQPLGPRPRPPAIPARRDFANAQGTLYVYDVYRGTHMAGVKRGAVRFLRVVESPEKRTWTGPAWNGQGQEAPAMNWHDFSSKRILGTVPVEADGSAAFTLPSDTFVFFQLLDENGMMVQSMRSGAQVQSGERTGCIGCHESRLVAPPLPAGPLPAALRRPPSALTGWHGEPRPFSFMAEVQPVLDRHCLRCHDFGGKGATKLILAPDRNPAFNTAYTELWRKGYLHAIGGGPAEIQPAYSWGSHASRLVAHLRQGCKDLKLDAESLERIITWVDLNAPYYPTYASAYPDSAYGRCPLDNAQLERLKQLGVWNDDPLRVVFERPEHSPGLSVFPSPEAAGYAEALAIIRSGRDRLAARPRADMPGFTPCETDARREAKYLARREIEQRNRAAIRAGDRLADP